MSFVKSSENATFAGGSVSEVSIDMLVRSTLSSGRFKVFWRNSFCKTLAITSVLRGMGANLEAQYMFGLEY